MMNHRCSRISFTVMHLLFICILAGCGAGKIGGAVDMYYAGRTDAALQTLEEETDISSRERLLYYMEKGSIHHHAGEYEKSADALRKASKLMDQQEVISVSEQAVSTVTSEWATEYKGEYSERLWVHTYLMRDYTLLRRFESARVEAKKALKVLEKHAEPLSRDFFTRAMIALCFENMRNFNAAYIEYKRLAETLPTPAPVALPLVRIGSALGIQSAKDYQNDIPAEIRTANEAAAEIIVFLAAGSAPEKRAGNVYIPPATRFSFPKYVASSSIAPPVNMIGPTGYLPATRIITHMNEIAEASLNARAVKLFAKESVRVAAKEVIARSVEDENEVIGMLLRVAFFAMEEPDTRCWRSLPGTMQLVRTYVPPATPFIRIVAGGISQTIDLPMLSPGGRHFVSIRSSYY